MTALQLILLTTSLGGAGTIAGALSAYILLQKGAISKNSLHFLVALGGGLLVAAIALVLVPEGTRVLPMSWASLAFFAGSVVFLLIDLWIERQKGRMSQLLANTLDSLPEAVGVGAAFVAGGTVGPLLVLLLGLQNIAEGFNSFHEIQSSGMSNRNNFFLQFISSLAGPVGGILGFYFLAGHDIMIGVLFMFSAGGLLYLIFHDIAPLAHPKGHWVPTLGAALGFAMGLIGQALVG